MNVLYKPEITASILTIVSICETCYLCAYTNLTTLKVLVLTYSVLLGCVSYVLWKQKEIKDNEKR